MNIKKYSFIVLQIWYHLITSYFITIISSKYMIDVIIFIFQQINIYIFFKIFARETLDGTARIRQDLHQENLTVYIKS